MNFKHKESGAVISENDFINLHGSKREAFLEVRDAPTHTVGQRDNYREDEAGNPVLTEIAKTVLTPVQTDAGDSLSIDASNGQVSQGAPDPPGGIIFGPESVEDKQDQSNPVNQTSEPSAPDYGRSAMASTEVLEAWAKVKELASRGKVLKIQRIESDKSIAVLDAFFGIEEKKTDEVQSL